MSIISLLVSGLKTDRSFPVCYFGNTEGKEVKPTSQLWIDQIKEKNSSHHFLTIFKTFFTLPTLRMGWLHETLLLLFPGSVFGQIEKQKPVCVSRKKGYFEKPADWEGEFMGEERRGFRRWPQFQLWPLGTCEHLLKTEPENLVSGYQTPPSKYALWSPNLSKTVQFCDCSYSHCFEEASSQAWYWKTHLGKYFSLI